jgi:hypothetical protein
LTFVSRSSDSACRYGSPSLGNSASSPTGFSHPEPRLIAFGASWMSPNSSAPLASNRTNTCWFGGGSSLAPASSACPLGSRTPVRARLCREDWAFVGRNAPQCWKVSHHSSFCRPPMSTLSDSPEIDKTLADLCTKLECKSSTDLGRTAIAPI